jgi:signal transduction histidine kinase
VIEPLTGMSPVTRALLQIGILTVVPVTVVCAMLMGGFARPSEVQELGSWLGTADVERMSLRDAVARALGDPSVALAFWAPQIDRYVDENGNPVDLPEPATGRAFVEVTIGRRPVAVIGYDAALIDDAAEVAAAGSVIALALDRERLTAELLVSRTELERSRTRILQVADRERQRIAQNLHDGLQAELVLLGVQAQGLGDIPGAGHDVGLAATRLRERVDQAAAGLRELVHAVMPLPLVMRGLVPAVEDLVDRMPVPTGFEPAVTRPLGEQVESTAYFIVAEALSNAVKHSAAGRIVVGLTTNDDRLTVEVRDDGAGGATVDGGLGLVGLTDRVAALGGRLVIDSPRGHGTRVTAELPCGS